MKFQYYIIFGFFFLINPIFGQISVDLSTNVTSPIFSSTFRGSVEVGIGDHLGLKNVIDYYNADAMPSLARSATIFYDGVEKTGINFMGEIVYYYNPYNGVDQQYFAGGINGNFSESIYGATLTIGNKHIFNSGLFIDAYIGVGLGFDNSEGNTGLNYTTQLPQYSILQLGFSVGYRIVGTKGSGTKSYKKKNKVKIKGLGDVEVVD